MPSTVRRWTDALNRVDAPAAVLAGGLGVALTLYVVVLPLVVAHTPMMTDLPFHTASAAAFLHYFDPEWHFQEQFELRLLEVPYLTFYGLIAGLMTVLDPLVATRVAIAILLSILPAGLAVLAWGMKKSPLLGLLGLFPMWGILTHWGFINHMAALGMFAAAIGLALRLTQEPSRRLSWALGITLVLILVTHMYRFPFAWAASLGAGVYMLPIKGKFRPLLWPLLISILVFMAWWWIKPSNIASSVDLIAPKWQRLTEIEKNVYEALKGPEDRALYRRALMILGAVAAGLGIGAIVRRIRSEPSPLGFSILSHVLIVGCVLVTLGIYLTFPLWLGSWFNVYPRAITTAIFIAFALVPNLPRHGLMKLGFVVVIALCFVPIVQHVAAAHAHFASTTDDMWELAEELPRAPKLLYLITDHRGAKSHVSPYVHLPAYIQATHGGWLSWHFSWLGGSPVNYRDRNEPGAVVPPAITPFWVWKPNDFDTEKHGYFFEWFLVKSRANPAWRFRKDKSIKQLKRKGDWWLFKRTEDGEPVAL